MTMSTFGDVDPRHANNHIYKNDYVLTFNPTNNLQI